MIAVIAFTPDIAALSAATSAALRKPAASRCGGNVSWRGRVGRLHADSLAFHLRWPVWAVQKGWMSESFRSILLLSRLLTFCRLHRHSYKVLNELLAVAADCLAQTSI